MLTGFLALLKSDGVNKLGELSTVLKDYIPLHLIKTSNTDKFKISAAVRETKRPVCLIRIDKKNHPDMLKLYFLTNTKIEWNDTIYLVSIFGKYAMINHPKTPEKLIKIFEHNKNTYPNPKDVVQPTEIQLSDLMEDLDDKKDFESIESFMKSYQSKQPSPNRFRFGNSKAQIFPRTPIPRGKRVTQRHPGTLMTREQRYSAANPFETPAISNLSPSASKTSKNRTAKNPTPKPANQTRRREIFL